MMTIIIIVVICCFLYASLFPGSRSGGKSLVVAAMVSSALSAVSASILFVIAFSLAKRWGLSFVPYDVFQQCVIPGKAQSTSKTSTWWRWWWGRWWWSPPPPPRSSPSSSSATTPPPPTPLSTYPKACTTCHRESVAEINKYLQTASDNFKPNGRIIKTIFTAKQNV